jgi:triosephosphate isomerase (TIM)
MRKKIVAGNWKMNVLPSESNALINAISNEANNLQLHQLVIFCVPFTHLSIAQAAIASHNNSNILLGAQNCHFKASGAFTGEISIAMLRDLGVQAVIIGHSERRTIFGESNQLIKDKVDALLQHNVMPIFCCGEPLEVREANTQNEFVLQQLQESLFHLSAEQMQQVVIAYEPIWAIGTGKTASTEQAQEMHQYLRNALAQQYDATTANAITILYGGSCNSSNAAELFAQADVDGGLIGGAALKADTFLPIVKAMA